MLASAPAILTLWAWRTLACGRGPAPRTAKVLSLRAQEGARVCVCVSPDIGAAPAAARQSPTCARGPLPPSAASRRPPRWVLLRPRRVRAARAAHKCDRVLPPAVPPCGPVDDHAASPPSSPPPPPPRLASLAPSGRVARCACVRGHGSGMALSSGCIPYDGVDGTNESNE
jgi:hypothetical protein